MLKDILLAPNRRDRVINDCVRLVDEQVANKSGLTGMAIKGAYAVVKTIKSGFIREAIDHLADDFASRLEPFYNEWKNGSSGEPMEKFFTERCDRIADALLGITDARAQRTKNNGLKRSYDKLRPTAAKHVAAAVPAIARLVATHAENSAAA